MADPPLRPPAMLTTAAIAQDLLKGRIGLGAC